MDGFQELSFERVPPEQVDMYTPAYLAQASSHEAKRFSLSSDLLGVLSSDPGLKEQWDSMVDERVRTRLAEEQAGYRAALEEEARKEGLKRGLDEARQQVEQVMQSMENIARELLIRKETILHAHEKQWCEALSHLLHRFLVPRSDALQAGVKRWLEESLTGFSGNHAIRVHVSPMEYDRLASGLGEVAGRPVELVRDATLSEGQIHCECDGGGIFFSPADEAQRLEAWLQEFFGKQEEATHAS